MTASIINNNINRNLLGQQNFHFNIARLPYTTFFGQSANIPGISLPRVSTGTPFTKLQNPGDHITWNDFEVKFTVDEDLRNWQEIFNWMNGLGFPDNFDQYKSLKEDTTTSLFKRGSVFSDGTLTIINSVNIPVIEVKFKDLFPVGLSEIRLETTTPGVEYIQATATFSYLLYTLNRLPQRT